MTALQHLQNDLNQFWQMPYHQQTDLAHKLAEVQSFQRNRINQTHALLFSQPKNHKIASYFIDKLYGGDEFILLAKQLERIVPKAQKLEKLIPSNALETGRLGIESAIMAVELDMQLAKWLLDKQLTVNEDNLLTAYREVNAKHARHQQIMALKEVCYRTDKYLNSFMLQNGFKLAKNTAYKYNYHVLYDFIAEGFDAIRPLSSVASFIEPFCEREIAIIEHVHSSENNGKIDPF